MRPRTRFLLPLMLLGAPVFAADAPGPTVDIVTPIGGWSSERIVEVSGHIESREQEPRAFMVVNGFARWIKAAGGTFKTTIVVSKGANTIEVIAENKAGEGRDSVNFYSDVPPVDLQVVLFWDTDGTDVDLHVTDPDGEECYFGHRTTKLGARLDVDVTDGFGPEVFTLSNAKSGKYKVEVKYYSSHGHPQTGLAVQVVMFEGTDREQRLEFRKILTKTGDKVDVGTFEVAPPEQAEG